MKEKLYSCLLDMRWVYFCGTLLVAVNKEMIPYLSSNGFEPSLFDEISLERKKGKYTLYYWFMPFYQNGILNYNQKELKKLWYKVKI